MAHKLVPGLEGVPEVAPSESQLGLCNRLARRSVLPGDYLFEE
jgi:hypothetical protein